MHIRRFERSLFAVATLALSYCSWVWLDSGVFQMMAGRRLDDILGRTPAARGMLLKNGIAVGTRREAIETGLVGRIEISRLRVFAIISEGTDPGTLRRSVGHVSGTAFPGEPGNIALAGHRDSFFSRLGDIRPGDQVRITTVDGEFNYIVDSKAVVGSDRTEILSATRYPKLTLITCFPFHFLGAAPERFVVNARPLGEAGRTSMN